MGIGWAVAATGYLAGRPLVDGCSFMDDGTHAVRFGSEPSLLFYSFFLPPAFGGLD